MEGDFRVCISQLCLRPERDKQSPSLSYVGSDMYIRLVSGYTHKYLHLAIRTQEEHILNESKPTPHPYELPIDQYLTTLAIDWWKMRCSFLGALNGLLGFD